MQWEVLSKRQSVTEWRDQLILQVRNLFNEHALLALEAFEQEIGEATVLDSVWDPAGFAHTRIDAALIKSLLPALATLLSTAASELEGLDARFAPLGEGLRRLERGEVPVDLPVVEVSTPTVAVPQSPVAATGAGGGEESAFSRTVGLVTARAAAALDYASDTASWILQDKIGLRERLRGAAGERIATTWMGKIGRSPGVDGKSSQPVLRQVISLIDEVARNARTSLL